MLAGWLNSLRMIRNYDIKTNVYSRIFVQTRDYAARKGTREKARKKKLQLKLQKVGSLAAKSTTAKKQKATVSPLLLIQENFKPLATDDVWVVQHHKSPVYSLEEAIECHRQTHHPTMFDKVNAYVHAFVELDMKYENRNKYLGKFTNLIEMPHLFDSGSINTVLALSKDTRQQARATAANADHVGGSEVVKQIHAGKFSVNEFDYVVSHVDILSELLLVRGLLKKKFPNTKMGNVGVDLGQLTRKFKHIQMYTAEVDEIHKDYGQVNITFGTLDMDTIQLKENFEAMVKNIQRMSQKVKEPFIQRVQIRSAPSNESFSVNIEEFLPKKVEEPPESEEAPESAVIENV